MDVGDTTVQPGGEFNESKLTPEGAMETTAPDTKFVPVRSNGSLISPM